MTSEQHQFTAQGRTFPVILVRKKVKNINLHVRSDGTLYLSAPARVPWAYIEDFLERRRTSSSAPSAKWKNGNRNSPY